MQSCTLRSKSTHLDSVESSLRLSKDLDGYTRRSLWQSHCSRVHFDLNVQLLLLMEKSTNNKFNSLLPDSYEQLPTNRKHPLT